MANIVLSASSDKTVRLWDVATGEELRVLEGYTETINSAAFSPDGMTIVSASADGTIRLWDAETGENVRVMEGHTDSVNSAAFSPDGKTIVSASNDNSVRLWHLDESRETLICWKALMCWKGVVQPLHSQRCVQVMRRSFF